MFPIARTFLKSFVGNEQALSPVQHVLASAAVAGIIVAAISSVGPDMKRIYSGKALGGSETSTIAVQNSADRAKPQKRDELANSHGMLAHLILTEQPKASDYRQETPKSDSIRASETSLSAHLHK